jgi:enoyl-[acyl-carrier-protein] reductase (NADH)
MTSSKRFPERDVKSLLRQGVELSYMFRRSCAEAVKKDFGKVDILVHSLANGPEVGTFVREKS